MAVAKGNDDCSIEGCDTKVLATGLCTRHYSRKRKTGTTDARIDPPKPEDYSCPTQRAVSSRLWNANVFA